MLIAEKILTGEAGWVAWGRMKRGNQKTCRINAKFMRLARECAKLHPEEERRMAEEGMGDYAKLVYGISPVEMKTVARRLHAEARKDRAAGRSRVFHGDIEAILAD